MNKFSEKYCNDSEWHQFVFVTGKKLDDIDNPQHWIEFLNTFELLSIGIDVCFVDQHPWLGRYETIKYMKDKARYIVLHDCDYFPTVGIFGACYDGQYDYSDIFRYFKFYNPACSGPPTLVGSDFEKKFPDINYDFY